MRSRSGYLVVAACLATALVVLALTASAEKPAASDRAPARWEHLAVTHSGPDLGNDAELSNRIIRLGDDRWELADVSTVIKDGMTVQTVLYFKRPK